LLQIFLAIALGIFFAGIKMLVQKPDSKSGSCVAACGLSIGIIGTLFLFTGPEGASIIQYPLFLVVLIAGLLLAWFIALKVSQHSMLLLINLLYGIVGAFTIITMLYLLRYIVDTGLVFAADSEEELPGFVFIFSHFGHLEIFMMLAGIIYGVLCFTSSILLYVRVGLKKSPWSFKGYQAVNIIILLLLIGYTSFVVYNTPVIISAFGFTPTTTDGTKAYSGLYDFHKLLIYITIPLALLWSIFLVLRKTNTGIIRLMSLVNDLAGVLCICFGIYSGIQSVAVAGVFMVITGVLTYLFLRNTTALIK
jgi:NAD/NADP transhydrogenase beta subunit